MGRSPAPAARAPSCGCCADGSLDMIGDAYQTVEGYVADADLALGCGLPTRHAGIEAGNVVLDLGSGAGVDAFVARRLVGEQGRVVGVDMTPSMIERARANAAKLGYGNVEFRFGEIEALPVEDGTIDVVISNCVLNLVPDKAAAFAETFRVLAPGGHFCVSDIVASGASARRHPQGRGALRRLRRRRDRRRPTTSRRSAPPASPTSGSPSASRFALPDAALREHLAPAGAAGVPGERDRARERHRARHQARRLLRPRLLQLGRLPGRGMRVLEEEAEHLPGGVRPARVGIGAGRAAARPGVPGAVDRPLLEQRPPGGIGVDGAAVGVAARHLTALHRRPQLGRAAFDWAMTWSPLRG